jgi:hypothetical protein
MVSIPQAGAMATDFGAMTRLRWTNPLALRWFALLLFCFANAPRILCAQEVPGAPPQVPLPENPRGLTLSPAADNVLASLGEIDQLPAVEWRVHPGDMPHGEAVGLDDSAWPEVKGPYLGTTATMWFRRTIVVPASLHGYDLTGANIRFAFDIWAEGPVPVIVYFDGRRVAMGEAMEPVSLFTNARPGDKIVVAVKALDSADAKHFRAANLDIEYAKDRPDPRTVRLEAISASYLIPALLDGDPQQAAKDAQEQAVLEKALALVDIRALHDGHNPAFDASLHAAQAQLELLRPLLSTANIHLTGNSHIDAAWVWPWTETVDVVRRTFSTALQLMREYPGYTYSQSAAAYYEWMAEKYPPIQRDIVSRIEQGRWEPVAPVAGGHALSEAGVWSQRAHWLESGYVRVHLAAAADLQEVGHPLFRDAEDGLERNQSPAAQALLLAVSRRQQGADLLSSRLQQPDSANQSCPGLQRGQARRSWAALDDAPVRGGRPRGRPDPLHA